MNASQIISAPNPVAHSNEELTRQLEKLTQVVDALCERMDKVDHLTLAQVTGNWGIIVKPVPIIV